MKKICLHCKFEKSIEDFGKCQRNSDHKDKWCKKCRNNTNMTYYYNNRNEIMIHRKEYYEKNKEKFRLQKNAWSRQEKNIKQKAIYDLKYRKKNKEKISRQKTEWFEKHKNDPHIKLAKNMRRRLHHALHGKIKPDHTFNLIGCTVKELKLHLEKQFLPGMSWGNYGFGEKSWHVDHIIMIKEFDITQENELRLAFHYTNLRPLWQHDNVTKKLNIKRSEQTSIPQLIRPKLPQSY